MQVSHADGTSPTRRRLRGAAIVALVVLCSWIIGLPTSYWGTAALNYDDSEYAYQALDTLEKLQHRGLLAWPQIIYSDQHYGKPPLFVNSLVTAMQFTGSDRPLGGIQGAISLGSCALLLLSAAVFTRRYGPAGGLLAVLAVAALPAFISWAPRVVPDIQVAFLALAAVAILAATPNGSLPLKSVIALGVVWGLGMHSKATYPLYAAGPAVVWMLHARSTGRFFSLVLAALLGLALTALWYVSNLQEAIQYVRGAADFIDNPDLTRTTRLFQWLKTLSVDGFGWLLALVLLAALLHARARPRADADAAQYVLLTRSLFYAAVPMLLIAVSSSAPPNTRHPLPSLILVTLLAIAVLLQRWHQSPRGHIYQYLLTGLLALQAAVFLADIQRSDRSDSERHNLQAVGKLLAPGLIVQHAIDDTLPLQAYAFVAGKLGTTPAVIYLAGHDGSLHVPKLNLLAIIDNSPLRFDYATYFSWSSEDSRARLQKAVEASETILLLENKQADADGASKYFNRHQSLAVSLAETIANDSHSMVTLADNSARRLRVLLPHQQANNPELSLQQIGVNFARKLTVAGATIDKGQLVIRVQSTARVDRNYKLMIHAAPLDNPESTIVLDQYVSPPLATWQPGNQRDLRVRLPEALTGRAIRVRIGFFDESDAEHQWPRLQTHDKQDSLIVDMAAPAP